MSKEESRTRGSSPSVLTFSSSVKCCFKQEDEDFCQTDKKLIAKLAQDPKLT